jgi:hypothetical protein
LSHFPPGSPSQRIGGKTLGNFWGKPTINHEPPVTSRT